LRLGLEGDSATLEEIGAVLHVTRERVRQICERGIQDLRRDASWDEELYRRLQALLNTNDEPHYIDSLASSDPWYDGLADRPGVLGRLIALLYRDEFHVWPVLDHFLVSRCKEDDWARILRATRQALEHALPRGLSLTDAKAIVSDIAQVNMAPDIAGALWVTIQARLHLTRRPDGEELVASIGRSITNIVLAILAESDRPLTLLEIQERLGSRREDTSLVSISANDLRNSIRRAGGVLFGRGLYGLARHLTIPEDGVEALLFELEHLILEGDLGRQWHCADLAREVVSRLPEFEDDVDAYVVDIILRRSTLLRNLGRLVWSTAETSVLSQQRHDIRLLVSQVLQRAGRPLSKRELRDAVARTRGLNQSFLPQAEGNVVRLAHGLFGLVDRDVCLSEAQRSTFLDALASTLRRRGKGLHVSEILVSLRHIVLDVPPAFDEYQLIGLAQLDNRFRVGRGHLIGLAEWDEIRRLSLSLVLFQLRERGGEWSSSVTLCEEVCALLERHIASAKILSFARRMGFVFNERSHRWMVTRSPVESDDDIVDSATDSVSGVADGSDDRDATTERLLEHLF
jgi:hypothetical protein